MLQLPSGYKKAALFRAAKSFKTIRLVQTRLRLPPLNHTHTLDTLRAVAHQRYIQR
ncbi:hypothetical protein MYOV003v1_p0197 [Vibrio phage 207E48.1]|nr:hypothetical protein MYOV003v1_p0197 [Vibrio phage 207E48.1]